MNESKFKHLFLIENQAGTFFKVEPEIGDTVVSKVQFPDEVLESEISNLNIAFAIGRDTGFVLTKLNLISKSEHKRVRDFLLQPIETITSPRTYNILKNSPDITVNIIADLFKVPRWKKGEKNNKGTHLFKLAHWHAKCQSEIDDELAEYGLTIDSDISLYIDSGDSE